MDDLVLDRVEFVWVPVIDDVVVFVVCLECVLEDLVECCCVGVECWGDFVWE